MAGSCSNTDTEGQLETFLEGRRAQPARGEVAGPAAAGPTGLCSSELSPAASQQSPSTLTEVKALGRCGFKSSVASKNRPVFRRQLLK